VTVSFWITASLLGLLAAGILFVPVWRYRQREGRWSPLGLVAAVAIAPVALGLYLRVSDWNLESAARTSEQARVVDGLIGQLEAHLQGNPGDAEGWAFLAKSYMQLGRYPEGRAAYERLWALTQTPDDELKIEYAEAQILADRGALVGDAGRLIEEVLASRPGDPKALWYGGLVALELGRNDVVRSRWTSLLALNPPEDVAAIVRNQLAALGGASEAPSDQGAAAGAAGPTIRLNVALGAGRSVADLGPGAQLFIFARAPEGGPPLAVIRQPASAVPGEFTLSDANSMIAGRSLATYPEITVVARLSRTGQPTEQPGDWFAQTTVRPSEADPVALVIDQVVQ
jgi:cytochrome c-type biogenesis protein CcmH